MTAGRSRRLPPNHQLVYDVVGTLKPGVHASAGDIFGLARQRKAGLGHSTVYRALARLCARGLVLEVHVPGLNGALYEVARPGHAHFVCRACRALEDIDCEAPAQAIRALVAAQGNKVDDISLTIHGLCGRCRGGVAAPSSSD